MQSRQKCFAKKTAVKVPSLGLAAGWVCWGTELLTIANQGLRQLASPSRHLLTFLDTGLCLLVFVGLPVTCFLTPHAVVVVVAEI